MPSKRLLEKEKIVGGAAVYAAYVASNFVKPINLVGIIGNDFEESEINHRRPKELIRGAE
jgi:hypothetical protein